MVNWRTDIRFLISCGETRTLLRRNEGDKIVAPVAVTGMKEPLPTTMDEGAGKQGTDVEDRVPASEVIWEVAPESKYQSVF
jgi:hypothetical protein